ncbi:MAG: PilZ domain-containing protein [Nitrospirae bacterium]|nr:PilZ domain-containing protein [Nitrospirota bacterium]
MSAKKQVLIICHTAAGQMYLGVLMNRIWFTPVLATTTDEAIRLARKDSFALVLFDGDLAEPDLFTAITLLRTDPTLKELPLVVFITDDFTGKNQKLLDLGCTAVLTKPLDLAIMYGVLARLSGQPRNTPRITVKMRVHVEIEEGTPENVLASVNMSESGLYLRTLQPLPEGTFIHIRFTLPHDTETITLSAEVVRTLPLGTQFECEPGMGLRFVDVPEGTLLKIRNFIQWELTGDLEWNSNL